MRSVDQKEQALLPRNFEQAFVVCRKTVQLDRNNSFGRKPLRARLGDSAFQGGCFEREVVVDIDKERRGTTQQRRLCGRGKGEGGNEHRIARPYSLSPQGNSQSVRSVGASDRMRHLVLLAEHFLQRRHLRSQDELPVRKYTLDPLCKRCSDARTLRRQVDEGNRHARPIQLPPKPQRLVLQESYRCLRAKGCGLPIFA